MIKPYKTGCLIEVYVQPNSKEERMAGTFGDPPRLKVKLKSPPIDGAANEALVKFFKKQYQLEVEIIRGATSRRKDLFCNASAREIKLALDVIKE